MDRPRFLDRTDAGKRLAARLREGDLVDPVVLGIPRGGVEVAAPVAAALGAELDVILSRKLGAPGQPELAIGAIAESGEVILDRSTCEALRVSPEFIGRQARREAAELERRRALYRSVRPRAALRGRSVIVVDDGLATGATMQAALRTARSEEPQELIVAVPVAAPDRLAAVAQACDRIVCLHQPEDLVAIGAWYADFAQVPDERVLSILGGSGAGDPV